MRAEITRDGGRREPPRPSRRAPLGRRLLLRDFDLARDPLVLEPDPVHELVVVDEIRRSSSAETRTESTSGERCDVDARDAGFENLDRAPRARAAGRSSRRVCSLEQRGEPLEPRLLGGELGFEAVEAALRLVDGGLGRAQLVDDLAELRA